MGRKEKVLLGERGGGEERKGRGEGEGGEGERSYNGINFLLIYFTDKQ